LVCYVREMLTVHEKMFWFVWELLTVYWGNVLVCTEILTVHEEMFWFVREMLILYEEIF
jgi:hypothetical protein